jgi:hypothetical protein
VTYAAIISHIATLWQSDHKAYTSRAHIMITHDEKPESRKQEKFKQSTFAYFIENTATKQPILRVVK